MTCKNDERNDGHLTGEHFLLLIKKPRKNVLIFKAPPQGLILNKVNYD